VLKFHIGGRILMLKPL